MHVLAKPAEIDGAATHIGVVHVQSAHASLFAAELRLVDCGQVRHDVSHHRAAGELLDCPRRRRLTPGGAARARFGRQNRGQLLRRFEVADEQLVFNLRHDRPHQIPPPDGILLDAQQIEQEGEVERADLTDGHGGEPRVDPIGRIVADALDLDGLSSRA